MTLDQLATTNRRTPPAHPRRPVPEAIVVLCYHGISATWPAATAVTPARLQAQVSRFLKDGYHGSTLCEALTAPRHERTLVVTFDDACRSVLTSARPILERLGVPGTVFVPTLYPDSGRLMGWSGHERWIATPHEQELACLSWNELRALSAAGWEIGSHTESHPRLTGLGDTELWDELWRSRRQCESELQRECCSLAYPYSDFDSRVVTTARRAGYLLATTVPTRNVVPLPLQWPRVPVARSDGALQLRMRAWRRSNPPADRAWRAVAPTLRRPAHRTRQRPGPA